MLVDQPIQCSLGQPTQSIRFSPRPTDLIRKIWLVLCLLGCLGLGTQQLNAVPLLAMASAARPTCLNTVSSGVYLDANGDGLREQDELFLAGAIQVIDQANALISSFQTTTGLFALNDIVCGEYKVYHDGDYVGKLLIEEVMGQALIELPKTKLMQHIFIPIINK